MSKAIDDVLAERKRQIEVEGFDAAHDDAQNSNELEDAAACYALGTDVYWPWYPEYWKPTTPRRNYVKAAALLIAAIEKIDREQG